MQQTSNRLIVVILGMMLLLALCGKAHAQSVSGFAEIQTNVSADEAKPELNVYLHGPLKGKVGWTTWTISSKEWSEGLAGLTFAPTSWMEVQGLVGIETDDAPLRGGWNLWFGKGRVSFLIIEEYGGSGYWYRTLGTFAVRKDLLVGVNSTRFIGTGPYFEKKFGKVSLWGTYAIGEKKGIVTGRFNF